MPSGQKLGLLTWAPMTESEPAISPWRGRTLWARNRSAPLRAFLQTESGSAGVLVVAVLAALVWANIDASSYDSFWRTELSIRLGSADLTYDLRTWINSGLMTLFFLVVGLEARREFDLGDLRERRRFILPFAAGLVGMAIPVLIFLALNSGRSSSHGWGVAMSTDTALALGLLALLGRDVPDRVRVFLLTVFVVDDLAALIVIAVVYSGPIDMFALGIAIAAFALLLVATAVRMRRRFIYLGLGLVIWTALMKSGVDPVVAGLAIGLSASAYSPSRGDLEEATGLVRRFREQPTPELARSATAGLTSTLSPNARLQTLLPPVDELRHRPAVRPGQRRHRARTPASWPTPTPLRSLWACCSATCVGKPVAVIGTSWALTRLSAGRVRPPVGWAAVLGSGTIAGIGFTVALLIATRAFDGRRTGRGEARCAVGGVRRVGADLDGVPTDRTAVARSPGARPCSATRN